MGGGSTVDGREREGRMGDDKREVEEREGGGKGRRRWEAGKWMVCSGNPK